jgi:hypothetical protein
LFYPSRKNTGYAERFPKSKKAFHLTMKDFVCGPDEIASLTVGGLKGAKPCASRKVLFCFCDFAQASLAVQTK